MDTFFTSSSFDRIRNRFLVELDKRFLEMVELRAKIEDGVSPSEQVWTEIGQLAHKLAGTSATLGFRDLGDRASLLDEAISSRSVGEHLELLDAVDELLFHMKLAQDER